MGNCDCGHCECDDKEEEKCDCGEECNDDCACDHEHQSAEQKIEALKKAIADLGYDVEETGEGIKISH